MRVFHPETDAARAARDRLLAAALREAGAPYPIAAEYPLVLGADGVATSYCLGEGERVVAHANLWPRRLVERRRTARQIGVGLVGNVATDAARRGEGLMRRLTDELKAAARRQGLAALILWSDLLEFYQKLGFASYGQERRIVYQTASLPAGAGWRRETSPTLALLAALWERRLAVAATVERTPGEFRALLTIPATDLWVLGDSDGYVVMGKGADMAGVVHEWGAPDPDALLAGARAAALGRGLTQVMVLAPAELPPAWEAALAARAVDVASHAMALVYADDADPATRATLARTFIWGLDSI